MKKRTTSSARQPSFLFLIGHQPKMIIKGKVWTVQDYIEAFIFGCPENIRPMICPHCLAQVMLHKHGNFERSVFTLLKVFIIVIYRFKCPILECQKTTSLLPSFVAEHHQVAWEIKDEVIRQQSSGIALANVAETLKTSAGKFSEKTLWRWSRAFREDMGADVQEFLSKEWQFVLQKLPHMILPVGESKPNREWAWLFRAWDQVRAFSPERFGLGILEWLYRTKRSLAMAVD